MKCIRCGHDANYKDRPNQTCPACGGKYAFEPRASDPLTDVAFKALIDRVSSGGGVRWNVDHLYYEYARRERRKRIGYVNAAALGFGFGTGLVALSFLGFPGLALGATVGGLVWMVPRGSRRVGITMVEFKRLFTMWKGAHGTPPGLIERPPMPEKPPPAPEGDLDDYSFDRAVICDRATTVDLLLANNFHFENNCAVLAANGYPELVFARVRTMLRRNPRLEVYVLHDATYAGCGLASKVAADPNWFPKALRVVDVGLRPGQTKGLRGNFQFADPLPANPTAGISAAEAKWLATNAVELAAIRPEQVLKRLFKAMSRKSDVEDRFAFDPDDEGEGGGAADDASTRLEMDADAFAAEADAGDGGADGFG